MDLGADLGFAWNFGRNRERVGLYLLFFLGVLAAFGVLALLVIALVSRAGLSGGLPFMLRSPSAIFAAIGGVILFVLLLFALVLVVAGIGLWLSAGIIKNAANEYRGERSSLRNCLDYAKTRFWTLVLVVILVGVLSFLVALPFSLLQRLPLIGLLFLALGILVRLILQFGFLFAEYEVIIPSENVVDSIKKSFELFLKNPLEVLLTGIVLVVAAIVLVILSAIVPVLSVAIAVGVYMALPSSLGLVVALVLGVLAAIVFLAELAFIKVFSEGFLAAAFLDLTAQTRAASAVPAAKRAGAPRKRAAPVKKKR